MPHELRLLPVALMALALAACNDKDPTGPLTTATITASDPSGDPSGNPSGDPSGDPTEDGTGASASDTGGTGAHGDCDQYVECIGAVSPETLDEAEMAYGPGGTCWQSTPELAQSCIDACAAGLETFALVYPDEPKCGGTPSSTTTGDPTGDPSGDPTSDPSGNPSSDPSITSSDPTFTSDVTFTGDPSGDPSSSVSDTASTTNETGGDYGNCGWYAVGKYYACGFQGPDPDGISPIDCPGAPQEGDACTDDGPINGVGCCMPNGDNYYCARGSIIRESCG